MLTSSHISRLIFSARYNLVTLYLFSKTDIKTIFIPVSIFAIGCGPLCNSRPLVHAIQSLCWIWIQLLHFNLANQTAATSIQEDRKNKPFRPLPSGRVTLQQASILRRFTLICGLALSALFGLRIFLVNVGYAIVVFMYHDHGDSHWLSKNIMNAMGYVFFESGSAMIAGKSEILSLGRLAATSCSLSFAIISTTIHAQDFQDLEGDKLAGRRTLPILLPILSRYITLFCLITWSIILCHVWNLDLVAQCVVLSLSAVVGGRCVALRTVGSDQTTYFLYNVCIVLYFLVSCLISLHRVGSSSYSHSRCILSCVG
ncbi:UbiA prenyltransferase family-domain-containing protein [Mycena polygramma]|nr:UbiA prenyltransferase family-domain-containing protein [Mycena polygramma]